MAMGAITFLSYLSASNHIHARTHVGDGDESAGEALAVLSGNSGRSLAEIRIFLMTPACLLTIHCLHLCSDTDRWRAVAAGS
jgi:hypothetical protein